MTTFVDLDTGEVIDVVDGRDAAAVAAWLAARPRWWRRRVEVVAIDPSASFRSAVRRWLPKARVAVDHFHLVKLGNDMLTGVRRRVSWDRHDRCDRKNDLAWAHRLLLSCTGPTRFRGSFHVCADQRPGVIAGDTLIAANLDAAGTPLGRFPYPLSRSPDRSSAAIGGSWLMFPELAGSNVRSSGPSWPRHATLGGVGVLNRVFGALMNTDVSKNRRPSCVFVTH